MQHTKHVTLALCFALLVTSWPAAARTPLGRRYIVNGSFTVEPNNGKVFPFRVGRRGAVVAGRFRAQGGSGNDIEVFILDSDGLENFRNGHRVPTYYNSGRVTVGTINVTLSEGDYHLVFNNKFSALSNKAVTASVETRD